MNHWALERYLPGSEAAFPRIGIVQQPTPVEQIADSRIWLKRDDLTNPAYGGNKVRKLDLILADAQGAGSDEVITFGATGTHHGLATAYYCREVGLNCRVFLFPQPHNEHVAQNLNQLKRLGAKLSYFPSLAACLFAWVLHPRHLRAKSRFVFAGGSEPLGVIAYINAACELAEQIRLGETPEPKAIYCATSSLATLCGLTLGCRMAGLESQVIGVRVSPQTLGPFDACTSKAAQALNQKTLSKLKLVGSMDDTLAEIHPTIDNSQYGAGYGEETPEAVEASQWFSRQTGLELDATYTAKAFAAVMRRAQQNPDQNILYWHTLSAAAALI